MGRPPTEMGNRYPCPRAPACPIVVGMTIWVLLSVLLLLAAAAPRYGTDTRTSDSWTVRPREHPVPATRPRLRDDVGTAVAVLARPVRRVLRAAR